MAEGRILTDKDLKSISSDIGKKADKSHTHTISDVTGLQNALNGKASSSHSHTGMIKAVGQIPAKNIQIIEKGGSTAGIPNETMIYELE